MISKFGLLMREIRSNYGESLRDLANKLGISAAFLSAMEVGKKKIPADYVERITNIYNLDEEYKARLEDAVSLSNKRVTLDLTELNKKQTEASLAFARKIKDADPALIEKLLKALSDDENKDQ